MKIQLNPNESEFGFLLSSSESKSESSPKSSESVFYPNPDSDSFITEGHQIEISLPKQAILAPCFLSATPPPLVSEGPR